MRPTYLPPSSYAEIRSVIGSQVVLPRLDTADDASEYCGVSADRLTELANAGYAPCVRIDGGAPMFFKKDILSWVKSCLLEVQGGRTLEAVVVQSPVAAGLSLNVPPALRFLAPRLLEFRAEQYSAVYFLVSGDEVVYVGQSIILPSRLATHSASKGFDRAFYLPVPASELFQIETALIHYLQPRLNAQKPVTFGEDDLRAAESLGISESLTKLVRRHKSDTRDYSEAING